MKTFVNSSVPDTLIYNTANRTPVQISVAQSACWMLTTRWRNLPHENPMYCDASRGEAWLNLAQSNFAIISHSLGVEINRNGERVNDMLIHKNTQLPAAASRVYRTVIENQQQAFAFFFLNNSSIHGLNNR